MTKEYKDHPLKKIRPKAKGFNFDASLELCCNYLIDVLADRPCQGRPGTALYTTKCKCLSFLKDDNFKIEEVGRYMIKWAGMDLLFRREIIAEWIRHANFKEGRLCYLLPTINIKNNIPICRNALQSILNIKWRFIAIAESNPYHVHGNCGKSGDNHGQFHLYEEVKQNLHDFFQQLKTESLPFATRIICKVTGTTTRNDNIDDIALPPHYSKHCVYAR